MKKGYYLLISLIVVIIDQFTKFLIRTNLWYGETRRIWGDFFRITYRKNPNAVFGISLGNPQASLILTILAFIFVCYLFVISKEKIFNVALSFIIGGAVGNLIDRFIFKGVTDFIDIGFTHLRWFTFNGADSFVTIGIIIALISYFVESGKKDVSSVSVI